MIAHEGIVISVVGDKAVVQVSQASACGSCHARTSCSASNANIKTIDCIALYTDCKVGDKVMVQIQEKNVWQAVVLAYVVPFLILLCGVWILGQYMNEILAGIVSILIVGGWYVVLRIMRRKLNDGFSFTACKI